MTTINIDSEKLLVLANDIYDFKDELDSFLMEVLDIEDQIAFIVDINLYKLKGELEDLINYGGSVPIRLEILAENLYSAVKTYESADESIKQSLTTPLAIDMEATLEKLKNGEEVTIHIDVDVPEEYADFTSYLMSADEAKKYLTEYTWGIYTGDEQIKDLPQKIAYYENGHLYIYELQDLVTKSSVPPLGIEMESNANEELKKVDPNLLSKLGQYKYECVYTDEESSGNMGAFLIGIGSMIITRGKSKATISQTISTEEAIADDIFSIKSNADFVGKLRGEDVTLKGVKTQTIEYVKRPRAEFNKLRNKFNSSEKKNFLKELAKDRQSLKEKGFSDKEIDGMADGIVPDGYNVHHKKPLDDSGTNAQNNFILMKNEPYHKVITEYQKASARGMKENDIKDIDFPIPDLNIYPPKR